MEKYLSITVDRLTFIDSLQFTPQNLDSLVKTLEVDEFKYLREAFPIDHEFELIKWKGVYPYDCIDSFARFDESRLPSANCLTVRVRTRSTCNSSASQRQTTMTYLKCDVLLLADFFEKFRAICLAHYILDAVHYYTAPGLAWDAALNMTCCTGTGNRYRHVPFHREKHSRWDLNDHH